MSDVSLQYKDLYAIIDALEFRRADYTLRESALSDSEEDDDQRADFGNDIAFLDGLIGYLKKKMEMHLVTAKAAALDPHRQS